jgi:3-hydroxymyristoyl/3-hydroxydecanoyl-(acyl carrier protein) dehydratase
MNNTWHLLKNLKESDTKEISAETTIAPDSLWFNGHFPGSPILPGIAQLALVSDALHEFARRKGGNIAIIGISRVRFRQFIKPNESLLVKAVPEENNPSVYKFKVLVNGQVACNGLMVTAPRNG